MITDNFVCRHNGPRKEETEKMLQCINTKSLDVLIEETIPGSIRMKNKLNLPDGINEYEYLNNLKEIASKNKIYKNYIGLGYYKTITPTFIFKN